MKFKNDIEAEAGFKDKDGQLGAAGQILSSTGTQTDWIDQSTLVSGSAERVSILVKNGEGTALVKGDPVYIIGSVGASARLEVGLCDASDPDKMPCVGLLEQNLAINGEGTAVTAGKLRNLITTPIDGQTTTENDTIYVKAGGSSGSALTTTKPTGSTNLIQNVGQVGRVSTSSDGNFVVSAIMRTNDVPNLPTGKIWVGDGNTTVSTVVHLDEANGRMGIGTASPTVKLNVDASGVAAFFKSSSNQVPVSIFTDTGSISTVGFKGSTTTNEYRVRVGANGNDFIAYTSNTERLRILDNGNVGIGTTSPGAKLHISESSSASTANLIYLENTGSGGNEGVSIKLNPVFDAESMIASNREGAVSDASNLTFHTSESNTTSERMRISSSGNVGIGTTSPASKLHVESSDETVARFERNDGSGFTAIDIKDGVGTTGNSAIRFSDTGGSPGEINYEHADNSLRINTNSSEKLRITSSGKVGIGTTNPGEELHISSASPGVRLQDSDGTNTFGRVHFNASTLQYFSRNDTSNGHHAWYGSNGTTNTEFMRLRPTGEMRLNLYGSGTFTGTATQRLGVDSSGNVVEIPIGSGAVDGSGTANYVTKWSDTDTITDSVIYDDGTNVGIGTTSPNYKLDIEGADLIRAYNPSGSASIQIKASANNNSSVDFADPDDTNVGQIIYRHADNSMSFDTNDIEKMRITSAGNVGIGTTSPEAKLDVESEILISGTDPILRMERGDGFNSDIIKVESSTDNIIIGDTSLDEMIFEVDTGEAMRITGGGNVGIGTTSPSSLLHLQSASSPALQIKDTTNNVTFKAYAQDSNSHLANTSNHDLFIDTNNISRITVKAGGNVGIGTTSPTAPLTVKSNSVSSQSSGIVLQANGSTDDIIRMGEKSTNGGRLHMLDGGVEKIAFYTDGTDNHISAGNVGIGTNSPSEKLEVAGNAIITGDVTLSNGNALRWTSDDVRIEGTTAGDNIKFYVANTEILQLAQSGTLATVTGNLRVTGAYYDSNNLPGTSGQVLSSTATGTDWVSLSEISGVDGTGTTNYVAKWSDSDTITDSVIYDNGTNVGIGTTSPQRKLEVVGKIRVSDEIEWGWGGVRIIGSTTTNDFRIKTWNGSSTQDRLIVDGSGNVGIGTTSPTQKLQVEGNIYTGGSIRIEDNGDQLEFGNANVALQRSANFLELGGYDGIIFRSSNATLDNQSERVRITSTGNVGIGTTSPSRKLQVQGTGNTALAITSPNTNYVQLALGDTDDDNYSQIILDNSTNKLQIQNGGGSIISNRGITLDSSENVGIGTDSPDKKLHIVDSGNEVAYFQGTGNSSWIDIKGAASELWSVGVTSAGYGIYNRTDSSYRFNIDNAGNVGIGTTSPGRLLEVYGAIDAYIKVDGGRSGNHGFTLGSDVYGFIIYDDTSGDYRFVVDQDTGNVGVGTTDPQSKLQVDGGVQMADDTDAASADKVGTLRYRTSGNNSYVDMCMQTGATTYEWVNIVQNNW